MEISKRNRSGGFAPRRGQSAAPRCSASIVRRKYLADLRPEVADELSVRIECDGQHAFFPLSENQRAAAEGKAETIRKAIARSGWSAGARFVREFTLAIFWLPNPLTCTYATVFTELRPPPKPRRLIPPRVRVALLEPDEKVRWGLVKWLNLVPGYQCVAAQESSAAFFKAVTQTRPDLALFNDPPCAPAAEHVTERFPAEFPGMIGFPFGIYSDSDVAWISASGVDGGYYYRRRRLTKMLEPISGLWRTHKPSRESVESQIRNHIQTLFGFRASAEEAFPELTQREHEVLLGMQRGLGDKAIATMLSISSWTVHTHVKSLFEKLGVHSRTEAVMKYYQK
jgi:DNA-binding NarL/FixJ family response regulator